MKFFNHKTENTTLSSVSDYRLLAKKRLPRQLFEFIEGGAFNEGTLNANSSDFQRIQLRKRVLKDVSQVDTKREVLGHTLSLPIALAPIGFAGVYARRGEVQAARAAEKFGIPYIHSAVGICSVDEVRKSTSSSFWYQFYMLKDQQLALELLQQAKEAGCQVLVLTIDLPMTGARHRYNRTMNNNTLRGLSDFLFHPRWFYDVQLRGRPLTLGNIADKVPHLHDLPSMRKWMSSQLSSEITWKDLDWIRSHWPNKIILKGIMDTEDSKLASESGMDGIVVSNHGGRHIDGIPSTISVLPNIVDAVGTKLDVLFDGGINSGLDIVKALAIGAKACLIGRAWAYALAARGEQGVDEVLQIFQTELKIVMAHLGLTKINEIDKNIIC